MTLPSGRRSIRLRGFDYRSAGWYFVTICARRSFARPFGQVRDGCVELSAAGRSVAACWQSLSERYPYVVLDAFVVMPDHVHGLLGITEAVPIDQRKPLGRLVGAFKTATVNLLFPNALPPRPPVWQRNYWERVVRTEVEFRNVRRYI